MMIRENADLQEEVRRLNERLAAAEMRSDWYRDSLEAVPAPALPDLPPPAPFVKGRGIGSGHGSGYGNGSLR